MKKEFLDIEERLKLREYKLTARRALILRALLENSGRHLCAEEILSLVRQKAPDVGLATVYRALELFVSSGIARSLDFGDGKKRYEVTFLEDGMHQHHHLICIKCGKITEVNEDLLEELEDRVKVQHCFTVTDHQLKIYGLCRNCTG